MRNCCTGHNACTEVSRGQILWRWPRTYDLGLGLEGPGLGLGLSIEG